MPQGMLDNRGAPAVRGALENQIHTLTTPSPHPHHTLTTPSPYPHRTLIISSPHRHHTHSHKIGLDLFLFWRRDENYLENGLYHNTPLKLGRRAPLLPHTRSSH